MAWRESSAGTCGRSWAGNREATVDQPDRPLLSALQDEVARLADNLGQMASLRWELARREALAGLRAAQRLAAAMAVALVLALATLPLVAVAVAWCLDGCCGMAWHVWLLIFAAGLLAGAALVALLAWRRFRREFVPLTETLEELREDVAWLREWTGRRRKDEGGRQRDEGLGI